MNKKATVCIALLFAVMLGSVVVFSDWEEIGIADTSDPGESIQFMPHDGDNVEEFRAHSLNGVLFEKYGAIMIVIGALMFGAMIAGVCISREEEDSDD